MDISRVTTKGQITLPAAMRKQAGLAWADAVSFSLTPHLIKPVGITDKTKTPEWKKMLAKAQTDAKGKRGTFHADDESLWKALK
jgi:bifunctional DNA-binding transcriptional regulator/antitoxin component of YhaV-PrlF toxin-antitoxin module